MGQDRVDSRAVLGRNGDPQAAGERDERLALAVAGGKRSREDIGEFGRSCMDELRGGGIGDENSKDVAAETADDLVSRRTLTQCVADFDEQCIADHIAVCFVDLA